VLKGRVLDSLSLLAEPRSEFGDCSSALIVARADDAGMRSIGQLGLDMLCVVERRR
jgi:hypothetical protein